MNSKSIAAAFICLLMLCNCTRMKAGPKAPLLPPSAGAKAHAKVQAYLKDMQAERALGKPLSSDHRVLANGIRLYVVSDPSATMAAIDVRVGAGHYDSPAGYRGLAHYLEHCLFLGSAKYPVPDEFGTFVAQHQGEHNAMTSRTDTTYIAAIRNEDFPETVDRLADFFRAPLFDTSTVDKQLSAIDSEYDKNIDVPRRQRFFLQAMFQRQNSPAHWVFQGNRQTLGHIPTQVMVDFFRQHYTPDNMVVVLVGSQSTAQLMSLGNKAFLSVPVGKKKILNMPSLQAGRALPAQFVQARLRAQKYELAFSYRLPAPSGDSWESKDLDVLQTVLESEAEGTLLDELKTRGWISESVMGGDIDDPAGMTFEIEMSMTPEGYKHWREIASGTLAYLNQIRATSLTPDMKANAKRMAELAYLYETKSPFDRVHDLAQAVSVVGPEYTYEKAKLIPNADGETFARMMGAMVPANVDIALMAPDIQGDQKAEFYDFSYTTANLADQDWAKSPAVIGHLNFIPPPPNPYLPQDLKLSAVKDAAAVEIGRSELVSTSLMRDNTYAEPTANALIEFKAGPEFKRSPENTLLNNILSAYVSLAMNRWAMPPKAVGYSYEIQPEQTGTRIVFSGFSERLPMYMKEFFSQFLAQTIDPAILARVIEINRRNILNRQTDDAYQQAFYIRGLASNPFSYSDRDVSALLETITTAKLEQFKKNLFASGQVRVLGYGNLTAGQLVEFTSWLEKEIPTKPSLEITEAVAAMAPAGATSYQATRVGANNVWLSEVQLGPNSAQNIAVAKIMDALIAQPFYKHMRSEKEYGYITAAGSLDSREVKYVSFFYLVQSTVPSPVLAAEGARWLSDELSIQLKNLKPAEFEGIRASILTQLRSPPDSADKRFSELATVFLVPGYPTSAEIAQAVEALKQEDVVQDIAQRLIGSGRHQFTIFLDSTRTGPAPTIPETENPLPTLQDYWKRTNP